MTSSGGEIVFSLEGISFEHPGYPPTLCDVSLEIRAGERIALAGANGSGKTTLIHLLGGLAFPSAGTLSFRGSALGEEALERPEFRRRFRSEVGVLFQNADAQLFCTDVREEMAFGPLQLGLPREEIEKRTRETLELLDVARLIDRPPHSLSAGEKKRVALASILVMAPSVLLLDEPTAGLDPRSQSQLVDLLLDLSRGGMTVVAATHDMVLLPHLADRLVVLGENHRILADGPLNDVLADEDLLESANLIHQHRHRHGSLVHSHPHRHDSHSHGPGGHGHDHGHDR
jgi:cobalt/nickel transport system ATP-binding protein